jgi:hypothetical protein
MCLPVHRRENLDPFLEAATKLGGHAVVLGDIVKEGWQAQRDFLLMATAVGDAQETCRRNLCERASVTGRLRMYGMSCRC